MMKTRGELLETRPEVERELPSRRDVVHCADRVEFEHQASGSQADAGADAAQQRARGRSDYGCPELSRVRKDQALDRQSKRLRVAREDSRNREPRLDVRDEQARAHQIARIP